MNLHDLAWGFFVALVYLLTFASTFALLVADLRLMFGKHSNPPWGVVFIISLLGPLGLLVALITYSIDKTTRSTK